MKTIFNALLLLVCMNLMLTSCIFVRHRITESKGVIPPDFGNPDELLVMGQIEFNGEKVRNLFAKKYIGKFVSVNYPFPTNGVMVDISDSTKFRFVMDIPVVKSISTRSAKGSTSTTTWYHIQITDKLTGLVYRDKKKTSNPGSHLRRYIKVLNSKLASYHP